MHARKGSITIYLSLTLTIVVSLFAAMLQSVRTAAGRVMVHSAMEQGMFSLFSKYHKTLLERFDLFYIDGGYGTQALMPGELYDGVREDAQKSLNPFGHGIWFLSGNLFEASIADGTIASYRLATDQKGNSFVEQITDYMEKAVLTSGIQQLSDFLENNKEDVDGIDQNKQAMFDEDPIATYDSSIETARREQAEAEGETEGDSASGEDEAPEGEPEEEVERLSVNPIETIKQLKTKGMLSLVVREFDALSKEGFGTYERVSKRALQSGTMPASGKDTGAFTKLYLIEYAMKKFATYTDKTDASGLKYQVEHLIGEKDTDTENLEAVTNRLLLMREASNMIYLYTNSSRKAEVDAMSNAIAVSFGIPIAQPLISLALIAAWAFAESILDVRGLLDGGKIPLLKDDNTWKLQLARLGEFANYLDADNSENQTGFTYETYLRILLYTKTEGNLTNGLMDLVEYSIDISDKNTAFRLDNCIDSLAIEADWWLLGRKVRIRKQYAYLDEK